MTTSVYTTAATPERLRTQAGRGKFWLISLGLIAALAIFVAVTQRPTDYRELSIDNSTNTGTRAVAQILRGQGVTVQQWDQLARVVIEDSNSTTLVIAGADRLTTAQVDSVLAYQGDVVFLGVSSDLVLATDPGLDVRYDFLPETVDASCADPDASAAERSRVEFTGISVVEETDAELCFGNRSDVYSMAVVEADKGTRTLLANPTIAQNGSLLSVGNAALALRTMGHHEHVAWYLADVYDPTLLGTNPGEPGDLSVAPDLLPPGFGTAIYALALTALVAALWKGRRFGPLAVEPLPVVVRSSEATRGRARLYRRARAYGRATAALRASAARRMGGRLGVPRASERDALVAAVSRASGRPAPDVARILYGPAPDTEAQMMSLIDELDSLEGQVHRS